MIVGYAHVQLAIPAGGEGTARTYYGALLAMTEIAKPPALAVRGGCWFTAANTELHLGIEEPFTPARKAHPALLVEDLDRLRARLTDAGYEAVANDAEIDGGRRFHTHDPFGNRLEFQQN